MIDNGRVVGVFVHTCGPDEPWYNCELCRATSGYTVSLAGMSVKPEDYLPPMGEVMAKRDEETAAVGGNHHVTTIGDER